MPNRKFALRFALCLGILPLLLLAAHGAAPAEDVKIIPIPLPEYSANGMEEGKSVLEILKSRARTDPFNVVATLIFFCAIFHTFFASKFQKMAHHAEEHHQAALREKGKDEEEVSFKATILHFLGEIEAVFGLWLIPLAISAVCFYGWSSFENYVNHVNYAEPMFVLVIMVISASRPVLSFAEKVLGLVASIGKGTAAAWWLAILTVGPMLGSFITEPGAMTICAMLLVSKLYKLHPSSKLAYGTLGLLFVNISVGGTLTNFAAPPILMVAQKFEWSSLHVFLNLGVSSMCAIAFNTTLYFLFFRKELASLNEKMQAAGQKERQRKKLEDTDDDIPVWITMTHLAFMAWTVFTVHSIPLCIGGFLFYLAFVQATKHLQTRLALRPALLVAFFLAGLVIHGGFQGWWIEPVIGSLTEWPMMIGATVLTAFNDNAAITYLGSQVPGLSEALRHALVAGAVAGGGLTVIANAPNPAGQAILGKHIPGGVSPGKLFLGALIPTLVVMPVLMLLHTLLGVSTIQ